LSNNYSRISITRIMRYKGVSIVDVVFIIK
jgi:hypothetical protein